MTTKILEYTSNKISECYKNRMLIPILAGIEAGIIEKNSIANLQDFQKEDYKKIYKELKQSLYNKTACITMLAGSGSRWISSLEQAHENGKYLQTSVDLPRGLFPVKNHMKTGCDTIPIASYAVKAVNSCGKHIIIVRGYEEEITNSIIKRTNCLPCTFVTQKEFKGKPRGHGDAAFQAMEYWKNSKYVIVNFGGDAASPLSVLSALLAMDALSKNGDNAPAVLLPVTVKENPSYPISLDDNGIPIHFKHAKLQGTKNTQTSFGYTNVGVRVYHSDALCNMIEKIRASYWDKTNGYFIPGNDPSGLEFALDNVDEMFASLGLARILPVSSPEELSPVKSLTDLDKFDNDVKLVAKDWEFFD